MKHYDDIRRMVMFYYDVAEILDKDKEYTINVNREIEYSFGNTNMRIYFHWQEVYDILFGDDVELKHKLQLVMRKNYIFLESLDGFFISYQLVNARKGQEEIKEYDKGYVDCLFDVGLNMIRRALHKFRNVNVVAKDNALEVLHC